MSKRQILILIGVWVIVFTFLGFPIVWQQILAVITGVAMIILAYVMRQDLPKADDRQVPFVEHKSEINNPNPPVSE